MLKKYYKKWIVCLDYFYFIYLQLFTYTFKNKRLWILFQFCMWNVLWLAWNIFIICFYLNVGVLDKVSKECDYIASIQYLSVCTFIVDIYAIWCESLYKYVVYNIAISSFRIAIFLISVLVVFHGGT